MSFDYRKVIKERDKELTEEKQEKGEEDQNLEQVLKSLKIVVHIFFWGGILSIISIIARSIFLFAGYRYIMVNFSLAGIFGIWISNGLARFQKRWRREAMFFLWAGVVFAPLALLSLIGMNIFSNDLEVHGNFSILGLVMIVSLAVLFYVILGGWQVYILHRKDVSLFFKRTKSTSPKESPEAETLPGENYQLKSIPLPLKKHKLLIQRLAIMVILVFIVLLIITPQTGSSADWKVFPRIDPATDEESEYGPFFAFGNFHISDREEIPAFIVYSRFEVKAISLNNGGRGSTSAESKIKFKGKDIEIPVKKPPEETWNLHEPSEPNVFLIKEDGTLERQPYIVKTKYQYEKIIEQVIYNKKCFDYEKRIKEIATPAE